MSLTALVVKPNGEHGIVCLAPDHEYDAIRALLDGGWLEGIAGENEHGRWTGYCDEEGKLKGLPINFAATTLAERAGWFGANTDVLCGPVVFFGPVDGEGDETSVTDAILAFTHLAGTNG